MACRASGKSHNFRLAILCDKPKRNNGRMNKIRDSKGWRSKDGEDLPKMGEEEHKVTERKERNMRRRTHHITLSYTANRPNKLVAIC